MVIMVTRRLWRAAAAGLRAERVAGRGGGEPVLVPLLRGAPDAYGGGDDALGSPGSAMPVYLVSATGRRKERVHLFQPPMAI